MAPSTMKLSEFKKLPKGTYAFDNAWGCKEPAKTSFGTFKVRFFMLNDKNAPDDEMLRLTGDLVRYAQTDSRYIRDIIYGSYRYFVTEYGAESVENCRVPPDLKPEAIRNYCDPVLVVERDPTDGLEDIPYSCRIIVNP